MSRKHRLNFLQLLLSLGLLVALFSSATISFAVSPITGTRVFINEFHYQNIGADTTEFIEIAGPAEMDLTGWSLVLYDNRNVYHTIPLTQTLPADSSGIGFLSLNLTAETLRNGLDAGVPGSNPDGIALVDTNGVAVQFVSYSDIIVNALDGPAQGMTSEYAGLEFSGASPDESLQLKGTGCVLEDFAWGDLSDSTTFMPTSETSGAANNGQTFENCVVISDPVINEFVVDNPGSDTFEYIEIYGDSDTDYSAFTLLQIEGEGTNAGIIDSVITPGTTNADGIWVSNFFSNEFENGTLTFLLVEGFTGVDGDDLDADNDGTLDVEPWTRLVDSVGKNDSAAEHVYSPVNLGSDYDSFNAEVVGASRIPDGVDTNTTNDWVRNDADGEGLPGLTGTPELGEAENTPGALNRAYAAADPVINEFVANHVGTDTHEFIEVFGDPDTDYSVFTVLEIEGDSVAPGVIDGTWDVGTTNAGGFWTVSATDTATDIEGGTITLLLVEGFTGTTGDDLDTNDDGTFDSTPWTRIVDSVSVTDGGASDVTYSSVVLDESFDDASYSSTFSPGGASRIPNGADTDSVSDWVRNDFDGEGLPGFTGTPEEGEALNTPDALNEAVTIVAAADPVINEFVANHVGTDTHEFIEVFGDPDTDYSVFTVLEIEGDSVAPGVIDGSWDVGTTNAGGFWTVSATDTTTDIEGGTITLLLVEGFTGTAGDDLDTNNDGTFDSTPWTRIVDSVAVNDGGASDVTYSSVVLDESFDDASYSSTFSPGGASRIPNGTDTDSASDWVRNDFDGEGLPGFTGTPEEGEALNTPDALNEAVMTMPATILINEVDSDTPGTDTAEFIELYDGGVGNASLDGYVVVSFNGSSDTSYDAIDLDGQTTDANGYFVICGNAANVSNCDLDVSPDSNLVQNGADAVALYLADASAFPNGTAVTTTDLVDAIVYDTSDADDTDLLVLLNAGQPQVNEDANSNKDAESNQRCPDGSGGLRNTDTYSQFLPTPGEENLCAVAATLTLSINGAGMSENGGSLVGSLVRTGDTSAALTVNLSSSDTGEAVVPASATIPANMVSTTFPIMAVDDVIIDGTQTVTITAQAAGFATQTENIDVLDDDAPVVLTLIHDIQGNPGNHTTEFGRNDASPLFGDTVTIEGIVVGDFQNTDADTLRNLGGFHVQEETSDFDLDATTSEGIFVFEGNSSTVDVAPGNIVRVTGTVGEFFGETQLTNITLVSVVGAANPADPTQSTLPVAVNLPVPTRANSDGELIPNLEQYEGMLLIFPQALSVTELFNLDRFGEVKASQGGRLFQYTNSNEPDTTGYANHLVNIASRTITIDDGRSVQNPSPLPLPAMIDLTTDSFRMDDTLTNLTGVLGFSRGSGGSGDEDYRLMPYGVDYSRTNPRPASPAVGGTLKVASFNVLNFFTTLDGGGNICGPASNQGCRGADSTDEYDRQLEKTVSALVALDADIVGLVEVENNAAANPANDGVDPVLKALVDALNAQAGAGTYAFVDTGSVGTDAIKVAYIYNTTTVKIADGTSIAVLNDAIAGTSNVFDGVNSNRNPLAVAFEEIATGEILTVVNNHFKSKGGTGSGADADINDGAGNWNARRTEAATALNAWLATDPTGSHDPDVLVIGDFNAYQQEDPIDELEKSFDNLLEVFNVTNPYSFVFDGQAGALDGGFASSSLTAQVTGVAEWHINADEPDVIDYNLDFGADVRQAVFQGDIPFRAADHDPLVIGLRLAPPAPTTATVNIIKSASPADGTDFAFVTNIPGNQNFALDVDSDPTLPDRISFSVAPGTDYSLSELRSTGWWLSEVNCTLTTSSSATDPLRIDENTGTVIFDVVAGDNLDCTFTNSQTGMLTISKSILDGQDTDFDFTGDLGDFTLNTGNSYSRTFEVVPGNYDVTELVDDANWKLIGMSCLPVDGVDGPNGSANFDTDTLMVDVDGGEDIECTFTNVERRATLTIMKNAPDDVNQSFSFTGPDSTTYDLKHGESMSFKLPVTQIPSVIETVPAGWTLDSISCPTAGFVEDIMQGGDLVGANITLPPGETICTFNNVKDNAPNATLRIEKSVQNGNMAASFDFTGDLGDFSLTANTSQTFNVQDGSYTVTESLDAANWRLVFMECNPTVGNDPIVSSVDYMNNNLSVTLEPGDDITCTFVNSERNATLIVEKVAVDGGAQEFAFNGPENIDYSLVNGESQLFKYLLTDQPIIKETIPAGWLLESAVCTHEDPNNPVIYEPYEEAGVQVGVRIITPTAAPITCVFTNVKDTSSITIVKDVVYNADIDVDSDRDFNFFSTELGNFILDDPLNDDADGISNTVSFNNLTPGNYTIRENPNGNWNQSVVCVGDDSVSYLNPDVGATIDLDQGENVVCTFTNERVTYDLTIQKVLADSTPAYGSDWQFTLKSLLSLFEGTVDEDFGVVATVPGAGGNTTLTLPLDAYKVGEIVPAGYDLQNINCGAGGQSTTPPQNDEFTILLDQNLTCVFTNIKEDDPNVPPTIPDPQVGCYMIGDAVNVNVMATDPDDAVLRYEFQNLPPGVIHADVTSGQLTGQISPDAVPGNYEVTVTVTDGSGNVVSITFDWCIEPPDIVCTPDPIADLIGYIYFDGITSEWTGAIRNRSDLCDYNVGIASYKKTDNSLQSQMLFDSNPIGEPGYNLQPGEVVLLTVDTPECAAQIDIYFNASHLGVYDQYAQSDADMPPMTLPAFYTGNYGPLGDIYGQRLIGALHVNGDDFCTDDNGNPTPEPEETQPAPFPDADWDGIEDSVDACPTEGDWGLGLDSTGCPYKDTDGDDFFDRDDACPMKGDEAGLGVDSTGCPYYDADWDGVYDRNDSCPAQGDEYGNGIDATGCPIPATPETPAGDDSASSPAPDADWDGIADSADACPMKGDEAGLGIDSTGCPYYDADWDGVFDRNDSCPARGDEYGNGIDGTGCPIPNTPEPPATATSAPETTPEPGSGG